MENKVSEYRLESINEAFKDASDIMIKTIEKYADKVDIAETNEYVDANGKSRIETSYYSSKTKCIYMNENKDNDEYAETFRHEYGHFIDDMLGNYSDTETFINAFESDAELFNVFSDSGRTYVDDMTCEVINSDVKNSAYISDILSAITHNNKKVIAVYESNGYAFYGHNNLYWDGVIGPKNSTKKECFANIFSIYAENNSSHINFIEKWFPSMTATFKKEMENSYEN